jgi:hypothetical protein
MKRRRASGVPESEPKLPGTRRLAPLWCLGILAFVVPLVAAFAAIAWWRGGPEPTTAPTKYAAIIDQLSLTEPNPEFVASTTQALQQAGYVVDYVPGEKVTVDLYRQLPSRDYGLIILRTHQGRVAQEQEADLFTGEPYSQTAYLGEQRAHRLGRARYNYVYVTGPQTDQFGVQASFIRQSTVGRFPHSLVIMMGCDGLRSDTLAQAFLDKGASAVVGWSDRVSPGHTDAATQKLLFDLLRRKLPLSAAVAQVKSEVGPDPSFGGELRLFPASGAGFRLASASSASRR